MPELKDKEDLSLLRFEGVNGPVFFVVSDEYGDEGESDDSLQSSKEYLYESHSCPTNWLRDVVAVIDETGNEDPHGFLKHVRTVRVAKNFDPCDLESGSWTELFPEVAPGYIPEDAPHEPVDSQFEPAEMTDDERAEAARIRDAVDQRAAGLDATTVARAFEVMLPARSGTLTLTHNPHDPYDENGEGLDYETAREWLASNKPQFTGPVEQQKIEETGELWVLEYEEERLAAASLPALAQWLQDNGLAFGS